MPIIKSAKKRVRVARAATIRNAKTKRSLRTSLKEFNKAPSLKLQSAAHTELDKAVKKGVLHKNKAARLKHKLAVKAKAANLKPAAKAKKPTTKKAAPKKKSPSK